jgi:hypothetical protein
MKKIVILTLLTSIAFFSFAQQRVALHHNGVTSIFDGPNPFQVAYDSAVSGDTIYIPGGVFAPPSYIDKRLHIYGAGHYPDTSAAIGKCVISGSLDFRDGADSSFVEGVETTGDILINTDHKVDYLTISRCKMGRFRILGSGTTPSNHVTLKQSVVTNNIEATNAAYCLFTNNIIRNQFYYGNNNAIYNNVFLYTGYGWYILFNSVSNCHIANNIVRKTGSFVTGNLNTFSNNAFPSGNPGGTNTFINNYFNQPFDSLFTESIPASFDYNTAYSLDSASNYLGNDSTQIGIYGGIFPWKKAAVPSIPHIIYKNIPFATEPNGTLDIQIKVNAEDY